MSGGVVRVGGGRSVDELSDVVWSGVVRTREEVIQYTQIPHVEIEETDPPFESEPASGS